MATERYLTLQQNRHPMFYSSLFCLARRLLLLISGISVLLFLLALRLEHISFLLAAHLFADATNGLAFVSTRPLGHRGGLFLLAPFRWQNRKDEIRRVSLKFGLGTVDQATLHPSFLSPHLPVRNR